MTVDDIFISKLTAYREAANQGNQGLIAVLCVLRNRVRKNNSSYYIEATKVWQFSSISISSFGNETLTSNAVNTTEILRLKEKVNNGNMFIQILSKYPPAIDKIWLSLDDIVNKVASNAQEDITDGATLYYAAGTKVPEWARNGKAVKTIQIGAHIFFKEL